MFGKCHFLGESLLVWAITSISFLENRQIYMKQLEIIKNLKKLITPC